LKIFVGYHFHPADAWVPQLVFPLIEAFGFEVATGERVYGDRITNAVLRRIDESVGLIGFLTRRDDTAATHRWVTDEIAAAAARDRQVLEVREAGVGGGQDGIVGDRQHVDYDPRHPEKCLVELAAALGEWARSFAIKPVRVIPQDVVDEIAPLLKHVRCTYTWKLGAHVSEPHEVTLFSQLGGLMLDATGVPPKAFVQVSVVYGNKTWQSSYEPIEWCNVQLASDGG
jgi:hypothetical protein